MEAKTTRAEITLRMTRLEAYFQHNLHNEKLFTPEYDCAKAINTVVTQTDTLTQPQAEKIVQLINATKSQMHYDGSGWFDFELQVLHLLKVDGFNVDYCNIPKGGFFSISHTEI